MSLVSNLATAFTRVGTEFKALRTLIGGSATADISALTTTDKTSLVAAINEVQSEASGAPPDASATVKGIVELATDAEAITGTDTVRALTPANAAAAYLKLIQKGAANGLAELDGSSKVPAAQLPSYVDDVIEVANFAALPGTGDTGKIYTTIDDNKTWRWSGSAYVQLDSGLALGSTSATAHRGDHGSTAYTHSQVTSGNPHGVTAAEVGALSTTNAGDHTTDFAAGFVAALT